MMSGVEIEDCIAIAALREPLTFTKLLLHAGEFLLLLLDLLREENIFILEKLYLSEQLVHLDRVFLAGVLEGGEGDVLARDEVLHVLGGVSLLLGREVVVEVHLLDLRLLLLRSLPFLELLVRR